MSQEQLIFLVQICGFLAVLSGLVVIPIKIGRKIGETDKLLETMVKAVERQEARGDRHSEEIEGLTRTFGEILGELRLTQACNTRNESVIKEVKALQETMQREFRHAMEKVVDNCQTCQIRLAGGKRGGDEGGRP